MSKMRNAGLCCGFAATVLLLTMAQAARAQVTNFDGGGDGTSWIDPLNWDNGEPNNLLVDAVIDGALLGPFDVRLGFRRSARTLTLGGGDTLRLLNGSSLTVATSITNAGTFRIESGISATELRIDLGVVTLTGGGAVEMVGLFARIGDTSDVQDGHLVNDDNLIHGRGSIGINRTQITNHGTVSADVAAGTLFLEPGALGMVNDGLLEATNQGVLQFNGETYTNTLGTIRAQADSSVKFISGPTIDGGLLQTVGTGVIEADNAALATLNGVTLDGLLRLNNGANLELTGTFTDNPSSILRIEGGGVATDLLIETAVTLTGGGTIQMIGFNARILDEGGAILGHLTNADHLIHGRGSIGLNRTQITNAGTIAADVATTTLTIDVDARGLVNTGTLRAENTATLRIVDAFANDGAIVTATGSTVRIDGTLTNNPTGVLSGDGTFQMGSTGLVDIVNNGTIAPGASPGTLTVDVGTLTLGATSTLAVELGGNIQGVNYDLLDVQGDAILGGTLDVSLFNGFAPALGDTFDILTTTGSLTGVFNSVTLSSAPGTATGVFYGTQTVRITVGLVGDLNLDGFVGIADLNIVLSNWNLTVGAGSLLAGDPSGDAFVGIADLNVVLGNWNAGTPPGTEALAQVPEPATAGLVLLGAVVLGGRRR